MQALSFPPAVSLPALPPADQTHRRTVLRDHVAALLIHRTLAGRHVYRSRVSPLGDDVAASLVVFTPDESCRQVAGSATEYTTSLTLLIEAKILAAEGDHQGRWAGDDEPENWDVTLDRLCLQVETALFLDPYLQQVATITGMRTKTGFASGGDFVPGVAVISFDLDCQFDAPTDPGSDLAGVGLMVDVIDPAADPNRLARLSLPRRQGPDGRIEIATNVLTGAIGQGDMP